MYLELLDINKIKQGQKTRKKKHDHVKKKMYKRRLGECQIYMARSYGIGRHTMTNINSCVLLIFFFSFSFQIVQHLSKGKKYFTVHSGFLLLPNMSCIFPNRSFFSIDKTQKNIAKKGKSSRAVLRTEVFLQYMKRHLGVQKHSHKYSLREIKEQKEYSPLG